MADAQGKKPTNMPDWVQTFPGAVTVSDLEHRIVYMNDKAIATWDNRGGRSLLGTNLMACHGEKSRSIIDRLLTEGGTNVYTIEKQGQKKIIYQSVWLDASGTIGGLVELSLPIPVDMPHYIRS